MFFVLFRDTDTITTCMLFERFGGHRNVSCVTARGSSIWNERQFFVICRFVVVSVTVIVLVVVTSVIITVLFLLLLL